MMMMAGAMSNDQVMLGLMRLEVRGSPCMPHCHASEGLGK